MCNWTNYASFWDWRSIQVFQTWEKKVQNSSRSKKGNSKYCTRIATRYRNSFAGVKVLTRRHVDLLSEIVLKNNQLINWVTIFHRFCPITWIECCARNNHVSSWGITWIKSFFSPKVLLPYRFVCTQSLPNLRFILTLKFGQRDQKSPLQN